ncbi:RHS repeat-associated core domain-containing protein [Reinekea marina]|uniref:RHS repeat-associated core domain-containing protein n=1 Tax=Reinekea marina TaxID=1310421 RepID=A0ABV7WTG3_9GAMM|nr:RHS repeat-associated core domain-containing protein [Reinekea marina]MDN3649163.1 RHS repeat-associated core domain-containing protein [Reinekea marina]
MPNQVAGLYGQLLAQNLYQAGNKETKVSGHLKGLQAKLYFHSDYQNSTLRVSGVDSQNNYGFRYNAYGVVSSQYQSDDDDWDDDDYSASSIHTRTNNLIPYQYTGKYRESISGFNHMDARWYNPKVGRFIQSDQYNHANLMLPKGAQSELMRYIGRSQGDLLKDPAQQMRYGYVSGNALRWVDPLGLCDTGISQDQWVAMQSDADAQSQYVQGWVSSMQGTGAINSVDELSYWAEQTTTAPTPEMAASVTGSVLAEKLVYSDDAWETLVIGAAAGGRRVPVNSHLSANPTTRMTARQNLAKLGEGRGNEIVRQSIAKGAGKASDKAPDFVVSPGGTAFPVPKDATGPTPVVNPGGKTTGSAFTGGKGGANGKVDTMRIMNPTPPRGKSPGYPNGNIKYENKSGQGVDPYTGRTLSNKDSHFPID